ncbi:MAG: hypothetical protein ACI4N4_01910 [Candidatus Fimenecus sp.]
MKGLFQIVKKNNTLSNESWEIIGTAFAIEIKQENKNECYLLTAYHNIVESFANNEKIILRDEQFNYYDLVEIVYPKEFFSYNGEIYNDFALLKITVESPIFSFPLSSVDKPTKCYIRGSAKHFNDITSFTSFKGELLWDEIPIEKMDEKILVLDVDLRIVFDENSNLPIDQQNILGGVSGSPIFVILDDKIFAVGVLVKIHADGSASKCYGVPMTHIINKCLKPIGLYSNIVTNCSDEIIFSELNSQSVQLYIDLLFGDPFHFSLEDCTQEIKIWNNISNQFYNGFLVDTILSEVISLDVFSKYSYDTQIIIRYYLAKFLFKRGKKRSAYDQFSLIEKSKQHLSNDVASRVSTLLNARNIVESDMNNLQLKLDGIMRCGDSITNIPNVNNIYIASECSSVIGKGLINVFSQLEKQNYSVCIKSSIKEIYKMHSYLLKTYPVPLQKQDIVNTSVGWLIDLWEFGNKIDIEKLQNNIFTGFEQATKRRNSIFHIQSLISYSLLLLITNSKKKASLIIFLVVLLMKEKKLKPTHEGINQLLYYMKLSYSNFFALFSLYFDYAISYEEFFLEKASILEIGISRQSLGAQLNRAHYIFDSMYKLNEQNIYFIKIDEIIELLD